MLSSESDVVVVVVVRPVTAPASKTTKQLKIIDGRLISLSFLRVVSFLNTRARVSGTSLGTSSAGNQFLAIYECKRIKSGAQEWK